jgi:hypothetical protein
MADVHFVVFLQESTHSAQQSESEICFSPNMSMSTLTDIY